jgi:hypothetical protein
MAIRCARDDALLTASKQARLHELAVGGDEPGEGVDAGVAGKRDDRRRVSVGEQLSGRRAIVADKGGPAGEELLWLGRERAGRRH